MQIGDVLQSSRLIAPELVIIATGIVIMLLDTAIKGQKAKVELFWAALAGIGYSFYLNLDRFHYSSTAFSGALSLDSFAAYFNVIFLFALTITLTLSRNYITQMGLKVGEYYSLMLFATSGMMILAASREFMTLFLGFEIMSISVYILSGFNLKSARSLEAGLKYLILGGFSSAILLFGIAFVYGATGSIYLVEIAQSFDSSNPLFIIGAALILTGFIFKIGAFPLHQWVPDVYEGAPLTVTGFMSVGVKAAAFAILIRVLMEGFSQIDSSWTTVLWFASLFSMIIGNFMALTQKSIKRMLAYSSIAHAGYALVGIVASYTEKSLGLGSVLYYLMAYTVMNLGAFGVLAYISRDGADCETFEDIKGLWKVKPWTATALAVFMFSLAGIPPTIGFFAKYNVFLSGISAGYYWLVGAAIVSSVISAYYYLRVLVSAFMSEEEDQEEDQAFPKTAMPAPAIAIALLAIATVTLGLIPMFTWDIALVAAESVLLNF